MLRCDRLYRRTTDIGTDRPGDEPSARLDGEEEPVAGPRTGILAQRRRLGSLLPLLDRPDRPYRNLAAADRHHGDAGFWIGAVIGGLWGLLRAVNSNERLGAGRAQ